MVVSKSRYTPEELDAILALLDSAKRLSRFRVVDRDTEIRLSRATAGAFAEADAAPASAAHLPAADRNAQYRHPSADAITLKSPEVGTFRRGDQGAEPFVTVGTIVRPDSIIGIIEIIRDRTALPATTNGIVSAILVEDGEPIEFGQPLMTIEPSE